MNGRPSPLLVLLAAACLAGPLVAEQKYNPYTGKWETVRPGSEITYNPHSGSWNYAAPGSQPEYNPHEGTWEFPK